MRTKTTRDLLGGIAFVAVLFALGFSRLGCKSGQGPGTRTAEAKPAATARSSAASTSTPTSTPIPTSTSTSTNTSDSTYDQATKNRDANDLKLLSAFERITGNSPPPEAHELLKRAHEGASDEDLRAFIDTHFTGFRLKRELSAWLDARHDGGAAKTESPPAPRGGNPRVTDAIRKTSP